MRAYDDVRVLIIAVAEDTLPKGGTSIVGLVCDPAVEVMGTCHLQAILLPGRTTRLAHLTTCMEPSGLVDIFEVRFGAKLTQCIGAASALFTVRPHTLEALWEDVTRCKDGYRTLPLRVMRAPSPFTARA